uniref:Uncharacterized protein n=1 Tax=Oryza brachyantha TaxID=4533 RepID=J3MSP0_ORYBR
MTMHVCLIKDGYISLALLLFTGPSKALWACWIPYIMCGILISTRKLWIIQVDNIVENDHELYANVNAS